jgi:hypothetical protein
MYYSYDLKSQIKRVLQKKDIWNENITSSDEYLSDIYDGNIYKRFLNSADGELVKKKEAFTFSLNTDGIAICEKSKLDIWSVYLVINEIRPEHRYCIENVIVAGKSRSKSH